MKRIFFQKNRQNLLKGLPQSSVAIVSAALPMQQSQDVHFPFRQDSNFWYLSGIDQADCTLVVVNGKTKKQILFIPDPDEFRDLWLGGSIKAEEARHDFGFEEVFYNSQKSEILRSIINDSDHVFAPSYDTFSELNATPNHHRKRLYQQLKRYGAKKINQLDQQLIEQRMIKSAEEVEQIEENVTLTLNTFEKVRLALPQAQSEKDIEAVFSYEFTRSGARHGYSPIIGGGINACTIHYEKNNQSLVEGELVLIDAGAERNYYHADITRTLPISGQFNKRQKAVHDAVQSIQEYAIDQIKPGAMLQDYEKAVREYTLKQLVKLELLPTSASLRDTLQYFPHASTHHLGVDVHDVANYQTPMKEGMVLTVEPGIYIPQERIGVRIEDDVVVTKDGCRRLGEGGNI